MATTVKIAGLRELGMAMKNLTEDINKKIARQAVAAGAKVVRDEARKRAPKDTGVLQKGIVMKRIKPTELTEEYGVTVSTREMRKFVSKSRAQIAKLHGPMQPVVVNGKTYKRQQLYAIRDEYEDYGDLFYGRFHEFGTVKMPARPFLRPALEENKQKAAEAIARRLKQRIDKVSAK